MATDYSACFSSFLKADDLRDSGPRTLTVKSHAKEVLKGRDGKPDENKVVLRFVEDDRGVTLNKTRFEACIDIFGTTDADNWVGKQITLVFDPTVKNPRGGRGAIAFKAPANK